MSMKDLYVSSPVRRISKIKSHPLPQQPPVWTYFLGLEAKNITISKNNIIADIYGRPM